MTTLSSGAPETEIPLGDDTAQGVAVVVLGSREGLNSDKTFIYTQ